MTDEEIDQYHDELTNRDLTEDLRIEEEVAEYHQQLVEEELAMQMYDRP